MSFFELDRLNEDVLSKKEKFLPLIISSIENEEPKQIAENAKYVCDFISQYDVAVVNDELLVLIVPAIKNSLEKCFEDNILIATTTDDMGMQDILKENLNTAVLLLDIFKNILEYFAAQENILLTHILCLPVNVANSLLNSFKHCKEGQDIYKNNFNTELLEVFKIAQDVHSVLLKTIESCCLEKDNTEICNNFLDNLSDIGDILSEINVKCMADNWKSYTLITKKITSVVKIDMTAHLSKNFICLEKIICKNIALFKENIDSDKKTALQSLKISIFLVKVVIKICETFWVLLKNLLKPILKLCLTIYSGHNGTKENRDLYSNAILELFKPFLQKLCDESFFLQELENYNLNDKNKFMFFNLLNNVFDVLKTCQNEPDIENLLIKFFQTVKLSYSEMTFGINLYDAALVNISVCILILQCSNLENILLANALQTNIWCNMLAVDIWCIILSNSESSLVLQTLLDLISMQQLADFGIFTKRIENSNLDNLIKRIYKLLPVDCNKHIALQYPPNENITLWNILGYQNLSILEKNIILQNLPAKAFCKNNLNKLENFQHFYLSLQYLEANNLITNGGLNINLLNDLWSFHKPPENILNNNIFKMYFTVLGKITLNNIKKLPKPLIMTILDQLLVLGCENEFKSLITDIIHELCLGYQEEFGPDQYKLYRILGGLIYPVLLKNCGVTIKIKIYDLIGKLNDSPAYKNVVKTVFQNAVDLQNEMGNFIKENFQLCLDPNYIQSIEKVSINHSCTLWKRDAFNKGNKSKLSHSLEQTEFKEKIKSDDKTSKLNFKPTENLELPPAKKCKMDEETPSDVTEALSSIKTEIKSLMKILKTDKISPKNASQLKIIISQLQSLL